MMPILRNAEWGNAPMKILPRLFLAVAFSLAAGLSPVHAEEKTETMQGMDHSGHQMPGTDHGAMHGTDDDHKTMEGMNHDGHRMPGMQHGDAQPMDHGNGGHGSTSSMGSMQGGDAPADARDPHAYSGGLTQDSGPYALPPENRLRMGDEHNFASLWVNRLEAVNSGGTTSAAYELQAWFGKDYDRLALKSEGHVENGALEEGSNELLWSHAVSSFWNRQLGVRIDGGEGPARNWLAFGYQGLAPYWIEVDATAYLGEGGRTALGLEVEYEIMLTQKWVVQLSAETALYGKDDPARGIGPGLSELTTGARLAYEFKREFALYAGIEWTGRFGATADYAVSGGGKASTSKTVAGLRFWF
jgi:copper resistance protein B